jgi:hypothetical protein
MTNRTCWVFWAVFAIAFAICFSLSYFEVVRPAVYILAVLVCIPAIIVISIIRFVRVRKERSSS